jgi:hypothetical protein
VLRSRVERPISAIPERHRVLLVDGYGRGILAEHASRRCRARVWWAETGVRRLGGGEQGGLGLIIEADALLLRA